MNPIKMRLAVFFCGTVLTIARTGRYPAGLVFGESGLSSGWWGAPTARNCLR